MEHKDLSTWVKELINEPVKLTLWWTILRNPSITAKELKKKAKINSNSIYYYLNQLEKYHLIDSELETIPKSNLSQKKYSISEHFIKSKKTGSLTKELQGQDREVQLFELLLMNSILLQAINNLESETNFEYDEILKSKKAPIGELLLFEQKQVEIVKKLFNDFKKESKNYFKENDFISSVSEATYSLIFAFVPLE